MLTLITFTSPFCLSLSVSFEDKLKENFQRGNAELEKRRLALQEEQKRVEERRREEERLDEERRRQKEREERERKERETREMELRRQREEERRIERQRELERQREEERLKELERREASGACKGRQRLNDHNITAKPYVFSTCIHVE